MDDVSTTPAAPISDFDRWVADNNIAESYAYSKGWWDYVEVVRRLAAKFDVHDVAVVGRYVVSTPPPEERLPMPAVALRKPGATVVLKHDFGKMRAWPLEWTVSVSRRSAYVGPVFELFDPTIDLRRYAAEGLAPDWLFGAYLENPAEFTCELEDEWDVATLLRLIFHEP